MTVEHVVNHEVENEILHETGSFDVMSVVTFPTRIWRSINLQQVSQQPTCRFSCEPNDISQHIFQRLYVNVYFRIGLSLWMPSMFLYMMFLITRIRLSKNMELFKIMLM